MTPERYMQIRALADKLIASCDGGRDYWEEIEALKLDEARTLDTMALECQTCNQWFCVAEIGENAETGEYECHDCGGEP
jgi:hypothetical protein